MKKAMRIDVLMQLYSMEGRFSLEYKIRYIATIFFMAASNTTKTQQSRLTLNFVNLTNPGEASKVNTIIIFIL
mgnify:FL=1